MERVATWRSSLWVRWLGWTVLYALVAGACTLAYEVSIGCKSWPKGLPVVADACGLAFQALGPGTLPTWSLAYLVPPLVAAFLIGVRFPFRWWPLGPPVAVLLVGTPLLLIPNVVVAPLIPESLFGDMTYSEAVDSGFLLVLLLLWFLGVTIPLVLVALVAHAGVRWGKRREASESGSTTSSLTGGT